jgi:uncharacterized Tic20 family protein
MSQSPDPNNPYAPQGGQYSPQSGQQPDGDAGAQWSAQQGSPYGAQSPYPQQDAYQQNYQQTGYDQQQNAQGFQQGFPQGGYQGQQQGQYQQGYQQTYQQQPAGAWSDVPPANIQGVYTGPMTGQPTTDSDVKLWSMVAQLSVLLSWITVGFLGWLGPLIVFLMYKDRNRYIRYNASEALNAAIAVVIIEIALTIVFSIIALLTAGIGAFLFVLMGVPSLVHGIFAIIGAVKANGRQWWSYPVNIRLVK